MENDGTGLEIEVKLRMASPLEALARLAILPADPRDERRFEDNDVFDDARGGLLSRRELLRLRVVEGRGTLAFKRPVETGMKAKVRDEAQTAVASPGAMREILRGLGFSRVYRYQKFRSYHRWIDPVSGAELAISLDETPIGTFVELEGTKESIDRAAARMGYDEADYIVEDYHALHRAWLMERGLPDGDMVFEEPASRGEGR